MKVSHLSSTPPFSLLLASWGHVVVCESMAIPQPLPGLLSTWVFSMLVLPPQTQKLFPDCNPHRNNISHSRNSCKLGAPFSHTCSTASSTVTHSGPWLLLRCSVLTDDVETGNKLVCVTKKKLREIIDLYFREQKSSIRRPQPHAHRMW